MISTRPYLIRAFYEWIVDSNCTPHIVVNADENGVEVPRAFVEAGQIVLNIAMPAVQNLSLNNDAVSFQARFGGIAHDVYVPVYAVMAIYARENGRGMVFSDEDDGDADDSAPPPDRKTNSRGGKDSGKSKAHLTVVK